MTLDPPRMRLEMPFLLMAGMLVSSFVGAVGALAVSLKLVGAFTSTEIFGNSPSPGVKDALENGTLLSFIFLGVIGAIGWGLWKEQWWARPVMVGFWLLGLTMGSVEYVRGLAGVTAGCGPLVGLILSAAYLYGKDSVRAYYRALESGAFPQRPSPEGGSRGVA